MGFGHLVLADDARLAAPNSLSRPKVVETPARRVTVEDDAEWVERALPWVKDARPAENPGILPPTELAIHLLRRGYWNVHDGGRPEWSAYQFGLGFNGIAKELALRGQNAQAALLVQRALRALELATPPVPDEKRLRAVQFSEQLAEQVGSVDEDTVPLPLIALAEFLRREDSAADEVRAPARREPGQPEPVAATIAAETRAWAAGRIDLDRAATDFHAYVKDVLERAGCTREGATKVLQNDIAEVRASLADGLPDQPHALHALARTLRRGGKADSYRERTIRHATTALVNFALWKLPDGFASNESQLRLDLVAYFNAHTVLRRYTKDERELLLAFIVAEVYLASTLSRVTIEKAHLTIHTGLRSAIGTYFLVAGPTPVDPSASNDSEEVHDESFIREEREDWPLLFLSKWRRDPLATMSAPLAIATLSGWNAVRARWIVDFLFREQEDVSAETEVSFWQGQLNALFERLESVRIASNPWSTADSSPGRSHIPTDSNGRFIIPDAALAALVAQGLPPGVRGTVHGHPFRGRRVPTYLVTSSANPTTIVKLDYAEKVEREGQNFTRYAKRLHGAHRPSACSAYPLRIHTGRTGSPLRAIETEYVFDAREPSLSLREWIRGKDAGEVDAALKDFLVEDMRPWLAHIRRDRVDLRAEYPILRATPANGKHWSSNISQTELARLEAPDVSRDLGFALQHETPECQWVTTLPGAEQLKSFLEKHGAVNPLWLVASIAEVRRPSILDAPSYKGPDLRDYDTLLTICHGDLHLENILCTSVRQGGLRAVVIDFESTHEGHICKDLAKIEASAIIDTFEWSPADRDAILEWMATTLADSPRDLRAPDPARASREVETATTIASSCRKIAAACGQANWPVRTNEYLIALLASLLPTVRYPEYSADKRKLALLISTAIASRLVAEWGGVPVAISH